MQGLIIVATLVTLVASFIVINTRTPKSQPIIAQPKHRQVRRPSKDRQKRYYQRRIRVIQEQRQQEQQQWLLLIAALAYHHYRAEQVAVARN